MELDKIIPTDGPNINEVEKYINKYQSEVIVIKCGGSVLLDKKLFNQFIEDISVINKIVLSAIVVHGGGKNIKKKLDESNQLTNICDCIGKGVENEAQLRHYERCAPGLLETLKKNYWHRAIGTDQKVVVIQTLMNRYEVDQWKTWGRGNRVKLGGCFSLT